MQMGGRNNMESPTWEDLRDAIMAKVLRSLNEPAVTPDMLMCLMGAAGYADDKIHGRCDHELG
jgi:hypothetical protein